MNFTSDRISSLFLLNLQISYWPRKIWNIVLYLCNCSKPPKYQWMHYKNIRESTSLLNEIFFLGKKKMGECITCFVAFPWANLYMVKSLLSLSYLYSRFEIWQPMFKLNERPKILLQLANQFSFAAFSTKYFCI